MGTVVTVMNMKGGVGKTTVTLNVGGLLSRLKQTDDEPRRVLLIDYDPQFNLSQSCLPAKKYYELEKKRETILSVLQDDQTPGNPYVLQVSGSHSPPEVSSVAHKILSNANGSLHLVPSTLDLMYVALGHTRHSTQPMEERFSTFIANARKEFDLIMIDCHPAGSILTKTSLENSDHVLIPVVPERYAVRGIGLMMQFINAKTSGAARPSPHILFNNITPGPPSDDETNIRSHKDFKTLCLEAPLRRFKAFRDPVDGAGFVWHSSKPHSTRAFMNLYEVADEFADRIY